MSETFKIGGYSFSLEKQLQRFDLRLCIKHTKAPRGILRSDKVWKEATEKEFVSAGKEFGSEGYKENPISYILRLLDDKLPQVLGETTNSRTYSGINVSLSRATDALEKLAKAIPDKSALKKSMKEAETNVKLSQRELVENIDPAALLRNTSKTPGNLPSERLQERYIRPIVNSALEHLGLELSPDEKDQLIAAIVKDQTQLKIRA